MELKISDEALKSAMSEAILVQLDTATREALIQNAIAQLLEKTEVRGDYGGRKSGPTKIEKLFGHAVELMAQDVIRDVVAKDPEVRAKVEALIRKLLSDVLDDSSVQGSLSTVFCQAFGEMLNKADRY